MAWQDVTPIVGNSGNVKTRVRYKVSKKFGCTITFPDNVIQSLGWKLGTRLKLSVGGGELFGKLKLAEDPTALPVVQKGKSTTHFVKLGRWSQLPDREVDRLAVEHQVEGKALIITLPSHALNVAPQAGGGAAARPPAAGNGRVDVIEKVAGRNGGGGIGLAAGTRTGR